ATLSDAPFIVTSPQLCRRCQPLKEGLSRGRSADRGAADDVDKVVAGVLRRSLARAPRPAVGRRGRIAVGLGTGSSPRLGADETARDEALTGRARTGEIGAVRRNPRTLQREDKILRRRVMPAAVARRLLRAVERTVDLDRGEPAAGIAEFARLRQARRVEDA